MLQAHFRIGVVIGQHIGIVNPGKGVVLGVFQQAGRTYRQRLAHQVEELRQLVDHIGWETVGLEKALGDLLVVIGGEGIMAQVVFIHEIIEYIGAQNHAGGHMDVHVLEFFLQPGAVDQQVDEAQAASLASQRTAPNTGKAALDIEDLFLKIGDAPALAFPAVIAQIGDDHIPQIIHRLKLRHPPRADLVRQPELGARFQPFGKVIVVGVIADALFRHHRQLLFQGKQVVGPTHFLIVGRLEHKIAETEVVDHKLAQVVQQGQRIFQQK